MVNRYAGTCSICGRAVPPSGGQVTRRGRRWTVAHLACAKAGREQVHTVRFASGETFIRNVQGRCEDAPCCGCCTI